MDVEINEVTIAMTSTTPRTLFEKLYQKKVCHFVLFTAMDLGHAVVGKNRGGAARVGASVQMRVGNVGLFELRISRAVKLNYC